MTTLLQHRDRTSGYQLRKIFALLFVLLSSVAGLANQFAGFYPPVDYQAGYIPKFVLVADFNRDGKLDILSVNVFRLVCSWETVTGRSRLP